MRRNLLLVLIGVLAVCLIGAGCLSWRDRQSGIGIGIGITEHGLTIERN